jgi:hypothetical protein
MVHSDEITQLLLCLSNIKASWRHDSFAIHCDCYELFSVLLIYLSIIDDNKSETVSIISLLIINIKTSLAPPSVRSREHDTVERSLNAMANDLLLMTLVYDHRYTTMRSSQWLPAL